MSNYLIGPPNSIPLSNTKKKREKSRADQSPPQRENRRYETLSNGDVANLGEDDSMKRGEELRERLTTTIIIKGRGGEKEWERSPF